MPYDYKFIKGHRDSKGDYAPHCLLNEDGKIVASASSKEKIEAARRARHANK